MSEHVRIFDTTLRDGEQSPGATMTSAEKLEVARALARLRVDVIEAGFPAASPDDLAAVRTIAEQVGGATDAPIICGLARAARGDIDRAWEGVRAAARPRIHTFLATSNLHMEHKLRMTRAEVKSRVAEMVGYARSLCEDIEFSPEDAGRSDPAAGLAGDALDRLEVARGGGRKAGLDDVDAEACQLARDLELLGRRQPGARGLLPVTQGRVEDPDAAVRYEGRHQCAPSATASRPFEPSDPTDPWAPALACACPARTSTGSRNGICDRSRLPTRSIRWSWSACRIRSKLGRPASFSAIQRFANEPSWMSPRTAFIVALT
jgi:hypothetical protein